MFPDDKAAEKWLVEQRWGGEPVCLHCGSLNVQQGTKHKSMPFRCREKQCAKRFSVRIGTGMEASNLGCQVWVLAMYQITTSLKGGVFYEAAPGLGHGAEVLVAFGPPVEGCVCGASPL